MIGRSARIVLATIGSLGDLHPCLALALALRERGHIPVVASTEVYRAKVGGLGLEFRPIRPDFDSEDPDLIRKVMDMRRGPEFLLRGLILPALRDTFEDLAAICEGADLLIAGEIVFAAPLVAEKLRMPWVSAILSPFSFLSAHDPVVSPLAPSLGFLTSAGWLVNRAILQSARIGTLSWWAPVRRLRRELGLGAGRNPLFHDKFSDDLTLAMFSRELARPQPDWPAKTVQTGFVYYDSGEAQAGLAPEIVAFLEAGEAPIVFTLGSTAVHDPRGFFEASAEAAGILGRRAVLLTGDNAPRMRLSPDAIAAPYAPFSEIFPRAAAIVHQGGVGTTAQALRSGRPSLIMPCGFDQPDNGARVRRLGAGSTISRKRYGAKTAARALDRLLTLPGYTSNAERIAHRLRSEDGAGAACEAIERLLVFG
jgi:UDP:flavonoid glycosyltransferase YjiC (YdhE family)